MFLDWNDLRSLPRAYRLSKPTQHIQLATHDPLSIYSNLQLHSALPFHQGCVNSVDWSHDGRLLATGSDDTQVAIWRYVDGGDCGHDNSGGGDANTTNPTTSPISHEERDKFGLAGHCLTGHQANIFSARFFPHQSHRLATAGGDNMVKVFDLSYSSNTRRQDQTLFGSGLVSDPASSSDMNQTPTPTTATFTQLCEYHCCQGRAKKIDFDPTQPSIFFVCSEEGAVRQWDTRERHPMNCEGERCTLVSSPNARDTGLYGVSVSPVRPCLVATCGVESVIRIYDRRNLKPDTVHTRTNYQETIHRIADLESSRMAVSGVQFAPNDLCLAASYMDGGIHLYDLSKIFITEPLVQPFVEGPRSINSNVHKNVPKMLLDSFCQAAHHTATLLQKALQADKANKLNRAINLYAQWLTDTIPYKQIPEYRALMACTFYNRALCIARREALKEGNRHKNLNKSKHRQSNPTATRPGNEKVSDDELSEDDDSTEDSNGFDAKFDNVQTNLGRSVSIERGLEIASPSAHLSAEERWLGSFTRIFDFKPDQILLRRQRFFLYALQDMLNGHFELSLHIVRHALAERPSLTCLGPTLAEHDVDELKRPEQMEGYGEDKRTHALVKALSDMSIFLHENIYASSMNYSAKAHRQLEEVESKKRTRITWSDHLGKYLAVLKPMDLDFYSQILQSNSITSIPLKSYYGHRNQHTIKEVSFIGQYGEYISSGGDGGLAFLWKRKSGEVAWMACADRMAVNMIKGHPRLPMIATCGIDEDFKIWAFKDLMPPSRQHTLNPSLESTHLRVISPEQMEEEAERATFGRTDRMAILRVALGIFPQGTSCRMQ